MEAVRSTKEGFREEPVAVKCLRCGYRWSSRSRKQRCSCPNCQYPNNIEKAIANAAGSDDNNDT